MRLALLSDIHGNLIALEAALADLSRRAIDQIVCLGDVAAMGPQPGAAVERLGSLGCAVVMGNTDEWLLDPVLHEPEDEDDRRLMEAELWSAAQLSDAHRSFLRTFQPVVQVDLGARQTLLGCHASPLSNTAGIPATAPAARLERLLAGQRPTVLAAGHTHKQMLRRYADVTIVNPGSVGQPKQADPATGRVLHPPWAEYALLDATDETLAIQFVRLPYDTRSVARAILDSGMPHAEHWASQWST